MIAVDPKSGWLIINKAIINNKNKGFKKLLNVSISDMRLTEYPEIYKIKLNLHISDGWIFIGPALIHLVLPFTVVPTSGRNSTNNRMILISIKTQSDLNKKSDGMTEKNIIEISPIEINSICLDAKWNGFP